MNCLDRGISNKPTRSGSTSNSDRSYLQRHAVLSQFEPDPKTPRAGSSLRQPQCHHHPSALGARFPRRSIPIRRERLGQALHFGSPRAPQLTCSEKRFSRQGERHNLDTFGQWVAPFTWINQQSPRRGQITASVMKAALKFRLQATFDLDCPKRSVGQCQEKVDLGACGRAVEIGPRAFRGGRDQRFDHEPFPACSCHRMAKQVLGRR